MTFSKELFFFVQVLIELKLDLLDQAKSQLHSPSVVKSVTQSNCLNTTEESSACKCFHLFLFHSAAYNW